MKQGDKFLNIVMFLLAAAVLIYFGHAAVGYLSAPLTTVTALEYEANAGVTLTGYVVRNESILTSDETFVVPTLPEGAHVGYGQAVANIYGSADALQQEAELAVLEEQLRQLDHALDPALSLRTLNHDIAGLLTEFSVRSALRQGETTDLSTELKGLVIRRGTDEAGMARLQEQQAALEQQYAALTAQTGAQQQLITAEPGYFSGKTDGYEAVLTPESAAAMTLADYDALEQAAQPVPAGAYGRLIRDDRWYYVAAAESAAVEALSVGDTIRLAFARDTGVRPEMTVERVTSGGDGRTLLLLSCDRHMPQITLLRKQTCDLIFSSYSGLRVPKKALHIDKNGQSGVYVLEGAIARWKPVELLYETSDNYVAKLDTSSTNNLWPGDEIILGNHLHDGKVVYP